MLCKAIIPSLFFQYFLLAHSLFLDSYLFSNPYLTSLISHNLIESPKQIVDDQRKFQIGIYKRNAFANYNCQSKANAYQPNSGGGPNGSSTTSTGSGSGRNVTNSGHTTTGNPTTGGGSDDVSDLSLKFKKGFAFVSAPELMSFGNKVSWSYNWNPTSNGQVPSNIQCEHLILFRNSSTSL